MDAEDIRRIRGMQNPTPMSQQFRALQAARGLPERPLPPSRLVFLKENLKERTIAGAFEQLLKDEINIDRNMRSIASKSQNAIREFLTSEIKRNCTFPRVLQNEDQDFIGGSFGRHTKKKPLDDIDIYVPLDGHSLFYLLHDITQPYAVITDGVLTANPLLEYPAQWMDGRYISSRKLINGFKAVLQRRYPRTEIKASGESVSIHMEQGSTEDNDGLGYDIVPCFSLKPHSSGEDYFYLIPDGKDDWLHSNPRIDQEVSDKLHRNNNKLLRKVVKLVKYWNTEMFSERLNSYYIELTIMYAFWDDNETGSYVSSLPDGLWLAFEAVRNAAQEGDQAPWLKSAPMVKRGDMGPEHINRLSAVVQKACEAVNHEAAGRTKEALSLWKQIFGKTFPTA